MVDEMKFISDDLFKQLVDLQLQVQHNEKLPMEEKKPFNSDDIGTLVSLALKYNARIILNAGIEAEKNKQYIKISDDYTLGEQEE